MIAVFIAAGTWEHSGTLFECGITWSGDCRVNEFEFSVPRVKSMSMQFLAEWDDKKARLSERNDWGFQNQTKHDNKVKKRLGFIKRRGKKIQKQAPGKDTI